MCAANTSVKARGEKITSSYQMAQAPASIIAASIPLTRLAQAKPNHTLVSEISDRRMVVAQRYPADPGPIHSVARITTARNVGNAHERIPSRHSHVTTP